MKTAFIVFICWRKFRLLKWWKPAPDLLWRRTPVRFLRWEFAVFEDKLLRNVVWQGGRGRGSKLCMCACVCVCAPAGWKGDMHLGEKKKKTLMSYSNTHGAWYANEVGCRHSESHKTLRPRGTCVHTAAYKQEEEGVYISLLMACSVIVLLCIIHGEWHIG